MVGWLDGGWRAYSKSSNKGWLKRKSKQRHAVGEEMRDGDMMTDHVCVCVWVHVCVSM